MSQRKFYDRLLIVSGFFIAFFVITMLCVPILVRTLNVSTDSRSGMLILSLFQGLVMFIAPSLVAARAISRTPARFLMLSRPPHWLPILGVVFAYLMALPALNQLIYWNANISFPESMAVWGEMLREMEDSAARSASLMLDVSGWLPMIVNLFVVALFTAFAEEIFFRGTLQHAAASGGSPHTAIWIVAFFFSALHFQIFGFVPRLLLGAWFGYLLFWSRSLYVPVFAHFLNNGLVVVCSWLSARGVDFDFEHFGVTEFGFPVPAFVSALATLFFLVYFGRFFFKPRVRAPRPSQLLITNY